MQSTIYDERKGFTVGNASANDHDDNDDDNDNDDNDDYDDDID